MTIDNELMLRAFREADEVLYFNACHDITMAGEDYKIRSVRCFAANPDRTLDDYIVVKHYDDSFLLMSIYTHQECLIREALEYFTSVTGEEKAEREIRTPYPEIFSLPVFAEYGSLKTPDEDDISPVYFVRSAAELAPLPDLANVTVSLVTDEDRAELHAMGGTGEDADQTPGPWFLTTFSCYRDTRIYLIRLKEDGETDGRGKIIGFLRAECGYANYYDVGWIQITPAYRGRGYAVLLALYFSHDCFAHGWVPHYGFAISPSSIRVAEKCGYQTDPQKVTAMNLIRE